MPTSVHPDQLDESAAPVRTALSPATTPRVKRVVAQVRPPRRDASSLRASPASPTSYQTHARRSCCECEDGLRYQLSPNRPALGRCGSAIAERHGLSALQERRDILEE